MEKRTLLARQRASEKRAMKRRLAEWGQALELCGRKQEELRRVEKLQQEQREILAENPTEQARAAMEQSEGGYAEAIRRIQGEIAAILRKKAEMDEQLCMLTGEEQSFVIMRYEKGYSLDYIGIKLHMSRATVFRIQQRALEKLLEMEKRAVMESA